MLYSLYAHNEKVDSFKTLADAMNVAQEDELLRIDWGFFDKGIQGMPSDTLYQIKKNGLPEISIELNLPNNVNCGECEYFCHQEAGNDEPEYTDCSIKKLSECPVIVEALL